MENTAIENKSKANGATIDFSNRVENMEKQLEKAARDTGKQVGNFASDLVNKTSGYVKTSRDYVKENPGKGVAAAAATGLVLGSLLTLILIRRN
jgi:ElaB/YqjD/DUF883 family membrane-anchored ribosome-binding protein